MATMHGEEKREKGKEKKKKKKKKKLETSSVFPHSPERYTTNSSAVDPLTLG